MAQHQLLACTILTNQKNDKTMAKLFVFAIGGTGSRVLRSLTMLLASGVRLGGGIDTLVPVIIDPDRQNGDLTRTVALMNAYSKVRSQLRHEEGARISFLATEIKQLLPNYTLVVKDTDDRKFSQFVDLQGMSEANSALTRMLFSERNLNSSMDVGFKGNPNMGSVVLNQVAASPDFATVQRAVAQGDRVFIVSSIFGGTGASGFPLLLKTLRSPQSQMPVRPLIGAVTLLPYFRLQQSDESEIDSDTFISKAKSALTYYEKGVATGSGLNALYYLGDEQDNAYENHEGMAAQRNDAHLMELLAATAAVDFTRRDIQINEQHNMELGVRDGSTVVSFPSFYDRLRDMLFRPMTQLWLMATGLNSHGRFLKSSTLDANRKLHLDKNFYESPFFHDVEALLSYYRTWLAELKGNSRSLDLFDQGQERRPFASVTGVGERKKSLALKRNYALYYHLVNKAARHCHSQSKPDRLLELYSIATESMVSQKINM